jgi:hypothetical protein
MPYLAVRCVGCQKEFAVERIDDQGQAAHFQRASFLASYTCPECGATNDYGSDDLVPFNGSMQMQPQGLDHEPRFPKRW